MDALNFFDGRPTEAALAAMASENGIRLDTSLVRKMADFALLVSAGEADRKRSASDT